jgi:hypothetical protein
MKAGVGEERVKRLASMGETADVYWDCDEDCFDFDL